MYFLYHSIYLESREWKKRNEIPTMMAFSIESRIFLEYLVLTECDISGTLTLLIFMLGWPGLFFIAIYLVGLLILMWFKLYNLYFCNSSDSSSCDTDFHKIFIRVLLWELYTDRDCKYKNEWWSLSILHLKMKLN